MGSISEQLENLRNGSQQQRDEAARIIVEQYFARLIQLANHRLGTLPKSKADPQDVAQSALKSFFAGAENGKFPQLDDRNDLCGVLMTLTLRKVSRQWEYHTRQKRDFRREQGQSPVAADDCLALVAGLQDHEPSSEEVVSFTEQLGDFLQSLPSDKHREIFLRKAEERTSKEIAEQLDISIATVERKWKDVREAAIRRRDQLDQTQDENS